MNIHQPWLQAVVVALLALILNLCFQLSQIIRATITIDNLIKDGTSVWCQGQTSSDRSCHFTNLCYIRERRQFAFLHSDNSQFHNFPKDRHKPALLGTSSIRNHNQHYFNFVDIPSPAIKQFNPTIIDDVTLAFSRFLPTNLMHVIHDDILPAYYTLQQISIHHGIRPSDTRILFLDNHYSEFEEVYNTLSEHSLWHKDKLERFLSKALCFKDIHIGLSKQTLWYQYGFEKPQGPLSNAMNLSPHFIHKFRSVTSNLIFTSSHRPRKGAYLVLLSRRENRLILNEMQLVFELSKLIKIVILTLEEHSTLDIIDVVSHSKGIIGMHGSLLSVGIFLPPRSILIELFPYAVPPHRYTPYKTITKLPGVDIVYRSWVNDKVQFTVTHEDWEPEYGGIYHLPKETKNKIIANTEVPEHLCCSDPYWLFRIYQDTIVDVTAVKALVKNALNDVDNVKQRDLYPTEVKDIECKHDRVQWDKPWNLQFISQPVDDVRYEVWIQDPDSSNYRTFFTENLSLTVETFNPNWDCSIWIRCHLNHIVGPFNGHISCRFSN